MKFVFFGGKGGVGKTTCAAAFACSALHQDTRRQRVLVISTDPAHSLGDALGVTLSSTPTRIRPGLHATELDAARAFARWLTAHRRPLGDILEHGTWLDREDVEALLDLSMPGVDEMVGLMEIARLAMPGGTPRYDQVLVDTAPTGHTLRLLAAPETVAAVADVLDALQAEHRQIRGQLARVGKPEAADRLIVLIAAQARELADRLRDRRQTSFYWVTLPEALSLAESSDAIVALEDRGIRVSDIVVNRVLPDGSACGLCDRRRAEERVVLAAIRRRFGRGRRLHVVPAEIREPRGLRALAALGRAIGPKPSAISPKPSAIGPTPLAISNQPWRVSGAPAVVPPEALPALRHASLIFFGGKGGVGKTTAGAAAAVRLARARPDRRVLLLSADPAHSLSDVFEAAVGDSPGVIRRGPKNLFVREIDAVRTLAARRAELKSALDQIASTFGAGAGGHRASELMDLAPPGIDELFGILSVVDARNDYELIIVDTAPTGHALRLLEMPEAAREWVQVVLRVLLKYRSLVRPGRLAAELVDVSKSVRELQAMLRDRTSTRFIVVTRAAELPRLETARLLRRLRRLQLAVPAIVVNAMTQAPGRCARCRTIAAAERRELAALRRVIGSGRAAHQCAIIEAPLSAPPPRGVHGLEQWAGSWIGEA